MGKLALLVLLFEIKHLISDYFLQGEYMLGKFRERGWFGPLLAHGLVHGSGTGLIMVGAALVSGSALPYWAGLLPLADVVLHMTMDRIKASPSLLGRFKALTKGEFMAATDEQKRGNRWFWWSLGIDQSFHHLTHLGLAVLIAGIL